jgi:hypothetical protein
VAPAIENGNPGSLVSWANYLLCFMDWYRPEASHEIASGPGHNTSYKREALLDYDPDLPRWLNPERVLHFDLAAKGRAIYINRRAVTHHVNISLAKSYLAHSFHGGRLFAASRCSGWSHLRAWAQAFAFPLVPGIRIWRIRRQLNTPAKRSACHFWAALPWIATGLFLHALGEACGYVAGAGDAMESYMNPETNRIAHVKASDRWLLADQALCEDRSRATGLQLHF